MKKIFAILILVSMVFMLASCGKPATEMSDIFDYFISVKKYGNGTTYFAYDPVTNIVYVVTIKEQKGGLSPYYTIINGKPEIAIYGVNWTEAQLP